MSHANIVMHAPHPLPHSTARLSMQDSTEGFTLRCSDKLLPAVDTHALTYLSSPIGSVTSEVKSNVSSRRFSATDVSVVTMNSPWRELEVRGSGASGISWDVMSACHSEGSEEEFISCRHFHQWVIGSSYIHCGGNRRSHNNTLVKKNSMCLTFCWPPGGTKPDMSFVFVASIWLVLTPIWHKVSLRVCAASAAETAFSSCRFLSPVLLCFCLLSSHSLLIPLTRQTGLQLIYS